MFLSSPLEPFLSDIAHQQLLQASAGVCSLATAYSSELHSHADVSKSLSCFCFPLPINQHSSHLFVTHYLLTPFKRTAHENIIISLSLSLILSLSHPQAFCIHMTFRGCRSCYKTSTPTFFYLSGHLVNDQIIAPFSHV